MTGSVVVGAAILAGGRVLAAQRGHPAEVAGRWELPGGRVEAGESDVDALSRECREELAVQVSVGARVGHDVALRPGLVLRIYRAELAPRDQVPVASEHLALRWLGAAELDAVDWLPADRDLLPALRDLLDGSADPGQP